MKRISAVEMKKIYKEGIMEIYKKLAQRLDDTLDDTKVAGKAEGIKLGAEKGKIKVAKNLLKSGVSIKIIVEGTGLMTSEIERLMQD